MKRSRAFTLIELMLVVAIIGLLAAIAIPKFANLVIRAKEAAIRGKLGSLRSAFSIYYSDNDGNYPTILSTISSLTIGGKYLDKPLLIQPPTLTDVHQLAGDENGTVVDVRWNLVLTAAWSVDPISGEIHVNCTHTDSRGTTWSLW